MARETELETALADVCAAAALQLSAIGAKGREPSPRLAEAFDRASALLGRDATADPNDRNAARIAEVERLRAEVAQLKGTTNA
jgi:hypothetical protein